MALDSGTGRAAAGGWHGRAPGLGPAGSPRAPWVVCMAERSGRSGARAAGLLGPIRAGPGPASVRNCRNPRCGRPIRATAPPAGRAWPSTSGPRLSFCSRGRPIDQIFKPLPEWPCHRCGNCAGGAPGRSMQGRTRPWAAIVGAWLRTDQRRRPAKSRPNNRFTCRSGSPGPG